MRRVRGEVEMLQLRIYNFKTIGNIWNPPSIRQIYRAIKIAYCVEYYLNYAPIDELADAIHGEIQKHPVLYDDPMNTWSWFENVVFTTFRASSISEVESLMCGKDYFEDYVYLIRTCFEAHPALDDVIGVEILIMPPSDAHWDSDTDEELRNNAPPPSSEIEE